MMAGLALAEKREKIRRQGRRRRKSIFERYAKMHERDMFYNQYELYGKFVAQEEIDLDRAVGYLDCLIKASRN